MKKVLVYVILIFALMSTQAIARQGLFIGAGGEYNRMIGSDLDGWENGAGLNLKLGYNDYAQFGKAGLEIDWFRTIHPGTSGADDAELTGLNINFKLYFTEEKSWHQFYLLLGYGFFTIEPDETNIEMQGKGMNVGAGIEQFLHDNLSLNIGATYRFITYNKVESSGVTTHIPELNGDMLSLHAGLNFYF